MNATNERSAMKNPTTAERTSDRELTVTRMFDAPARIVFEAWTRPELFKRWWSPKSCPISIIGCEMDVRVGGGYRLVFDVGDGKTMAFFGKYLEVVPPARLVWTNDEAGDAGQVTTVTFDEKGGKTRVVMRDLYASKAALDAAIESGATSGNSETFDQLEELLAGLVARA